MPEILEERLLIEEEDKKILKAINDLSSFDTGNLYIYGNDQFREIPTINQISKKIKISQEKIKQRLERIRKTWNIPEPKNLPTNRGIYDKEDALISAIHNQDKLRKNEKTNKYRVPKIHFFNSELGTGTLYANNKAMEGERLFRDAMGLNNKINSYHIQGIMPEINLMFGKAKQQRTIQTGLNKTGKERDQREIEKIEQILDISNHEMEKRDWKNLENYVINTIDSAEEAAKSVGKELGDLLKGINENVPIHLYWTYKDDSNLSEEEDMLIASMRKIQNRMRRATKELPILKEKYSKLKREAAENYVEKEITKNLYNYLVKDIGENQNNSNNSKKNNNSQKKQEFFENINKFFGKNKIKKPKESKGLKTKVRRGYFEILQRKQDPDSKQSFENIYNETVEKLLPGVLPEEKRPYSTLKQIEKIREQKEKKLENIYKEKYSLEDKISEEEGYSNAILTEQMEGHSWFTHKIAINPTEAKVVEMLKKSNYKSLYEDILIPEVKKNVGKDLNIKLHTDREISVYVPDPETIYKDKNKNPSEDEDLEDGTIITSLPRTNRQRSNEPLLESFAELQKFQKNKLAERQKQQKKKPKKYKDFDKREFSFSKIYWTSYGSDGFRHQPKFEKAPTRIKGEYRLDPKVIHFLKTPTRHDTKKLGELMTKGNKGTWDGKRLEKGGTTTGNVLYIEHPDQSEEVMFLDDNFYEKIEEQHGEEVRKSENKISELEDKLKTTKINKSKQELRKEINAEKKKIKQTYEKIKPDMKNIFLANDIHAGSETWPGRPSSIDSTRGSQLAALQSIGINNFTYSMITEALHGTLSFRAYDSKRTGHEEDPLSFELKMKTLNKKLTEKKTPMKEISQYQYYLSKEQNDARPTFQQSQQKAIFRNSVKPVFDELLENDVSVFIGAGNHWQGGERGKNDEGEILTNMFDRKYQDRGLIYNPPAEGNDFSFRPVKLPSNEGYDITALMTHKMQSGRTEISKMMSQAVGTKEDALFAITADRHHPGMISERNKFGVLDTGKQSMIEYANKIGKESSVRGSMTVKYGMNRELLYSGRYFLDNVTDDIIGWKERAGILKRAHSLIEEEVKNTSFRTEKKRMDYMIEKNKEKYQNNK